MKERICQLLTLVLVAAAISTTALALDVVEEGKLSIGNVTSTDELDSGEPVYTCEDYTTITLRENIYWINLYCYSQDGWELIDLFDSHEGTPVLDASDWNIALLATGETMNLYEYYEGIWRGTIQEEEGDSQLLANSTFTLWLDASYCLEILGDGEDITYLYLQITDTDGVDGEMAVELPEEPAQEPEVPVVQSGTARSSTDTVVVDGQEIAFEGYVISDNNYFKLRDIAQVVAGSDKQFSVDWDEDKDAIALISGAEYTQVGGELAAGDGLAKGYITTTSLLYVDGVETVFEGYLINGNNYFKLRDLCRAFDIGVTWDNDTETVGVDTTSGYQDEIEPSSDNENREE